MRRLALRILPMLVAVGFGGCAASPRAGLDVPEPFSTHLAVRHFRRGEVFLDSPPYRLTTAVAMTEYRGWWGPEIHDQIRGHPWTVRVYRRNTPKVLAAYANAKDGEEADLNEEPEFLDGGSRSYLYARFERKHFRWGDAVSFFSQFTQDTGNYVPHNGHLTYEVWGVTRDHHYTVVATVPVTHPKLADWGPAVRNQPTSKAMKKDRDYRLVETCSPDRFNPDLAAFDRMLDTLDLGGPVKVADIQGRRLTGPIP